MKNQRGVSTLMLVVGLVIVVLLGFVAFKLYIEPAKHPIKETQEEEKPSGVMLNVAPPTEASPKVAGLTNPASVNCTEKGGTLSIMKNGAGGEFGLCEFEDNMACEEWALMRGECPVGGVKTTGYDNNQQAYCAWLGGKTAAEQDATCSLPDGKSCFVEDLWNGQCS